MNSDWLLHYPVWELDFFAGGLLIAVIAVLHVYVAHFAVGGGLFLALTEMKGYRENSQAILDYTKTHSKFFLLLSMVFGSVTGVGIWFVISLLSPAATSSLIHTFVFAWATEWVFFMGEIVCLFVYFYTFGKMAKKPHLTVGWLYFAFAWLSLFAINGIVAFMLTPGKWIETRNFWDGFFNPSFFPSLFFRTCIAFMLAGLFGFITAVRIKADEVRESLMKYCSWWLLVPLFFLIAGAYWYAVSLPDPQNAMIFRGLSPEIPPFLKAFFWISPIIFVIGVIMALRVPVGMKKGLAFILLVIGLMYMGSYEWIREAGRRPYLIYGHTYSNSALAQDSDAIRERGILNSARWVKHRILNDENQLDAGKEIFRLLCISCHSVGGPVNDILPITKKFSVFGMDSLLDGMGKINEYMPPFMGTPDERKALAAYIIKGLHQKADHEPVDYHAEPLRVEVPVFDPESDEYVLLAWSTKGMYCITDNDRFFSIKHPGNEIHAQLIRRGELPEHVSDVKMTYQIEEGFETPSNHVEFWKFSESLIGRTLPADTGISGNKTSGVLTFDDEMGIYMAKGIPVVPYKDDGSFNPYPLMTLEARDPESDELLARTRIVAPVSTELGCKNCHGRERDEVGGISPETSQDILTVHDRINRTDLTERARNGRPVSCKKCHSGSEKLNISAALHGFHANYMTNRGADACTACHPASESFSKCLRGIHKSILLDCTSCHGKLEDHALSLLTAEKAAGKKGADRLMKHLKPRAAETVAEIAPRKPWVNEPDCLNCHVDFNPPETDEHELNRWTEGEEGLFRMRSDDAGVMCAGCHGSPHAIYPATNIFGNDRDNIPPMQYQENPYPIAANKNCKVCHTIDMEEEIHHPNSLGMFRNER